MPTAPRHTFIPAHVSRREFLRLCGLTATGLLVASCQPPATPAPVSAPTVAAPTAIPTTAKLVKPAVAIGRAQTYDRAVIEREVQNLIEQLGGLGDVVKPGDRVAIKINLTGGVKTGQVPGVTPVESFVTHPEVVRALVKQVQAAGAKEVFIVEAAYEWESFTQWGYDALASELGVTLVDLNDPKPYKSFIDMPVGANSFIYPSFTVNHLLTEVDVFMSVSKMKNHDLAGITHTMKNLYGLVPYRLYRLSGNDTYRSGFHGTGTETKGRLPRIIVDLNRARPIHFSLIDGVKSIRGGEGPWIDGVAPIAPGLLLAGKNCVATDSVAAAVMGYDPAGAYPAAPFVRCDNHIALAASKGLGPNTLDAIEVRGVPLDQARTPFSPSA